MKETQKQQIIRLEKELEKTKSDLDEYKSIFNILNMTVLKLQVETIKDSLDISDYQQIMERIKIFKFKK